MQPVMGVRAGGDEEDKSMAGECLFDLQKARLSEIKCRGRGENNKRERCTEEWFYPNISWRNIMINQTKRECQLYERYTDTLLVMCIKKAYFINKTMISQSRAHTNRPSWENFKSHKTALYQRSKLAICFNFILCILCSFVYLTAKRVRSLILTFL